MKLCPICSKWLQRTLLESNLPAMRCPICQGKWISADEYLSWLTPQLARGLSEIDLAKEFEASCPTANNDLVLICPDCSRLLRRFKIFPNHDFHLDHCQNCKGIWFDKNEWQTLQSHNFHLKLNHFFTEIWQEKLDSQDMQLRFDSMYHEVFGTVDYEKIKEIRAWIANHPRGERLMAYLTDRDPYTG